MSEQSHDTEQAIDSEQIRDEAEEIVRNQSRIAEKIEKLAVKGARVGERGAQGVSAVYRSVVAGAMAAVERAVPEQQEAALRELIDGLSSAGTRFANAAKLTFEEAKAESKVFSKEEIQHTKDELAALEGLALEIVLKHKDKLSAELRGQTERITGHARHSSASLVEAISEALTVVRNHPAELISDSAKVGVELSRSIAQTLLKSSSDVLASAANALERQSKS